MDAQQPIQKIERIFYLNDSLVIELVLIVPHVIAFTLLLNHSLVLINANGAFAKCLAGLMTDRG